MTDPTPTRDAREAAERAVAIAHRWAVASYNKALGKPYEAFEPIQRELRDLFLASAPAPASGGVDAKTLRGIIARWETRREYLNTNPSAYDAFIAREIAGVSEPSLARSALSPAATPVSGADNWRDIKTAPKGRRVLVKFQSGEVEVCYQTDHGGGLMDSWRYAFARRGEQAPWPVEWCEIPLAKPASSPAGVYVVQTLIDKTEKLIEAAEYGPYTPKPSPWWHPNLADAHSKNPPEAEHG